jgi:peptidoglycan hydrolase-like protein with peptidoglycan-binding domain
MKERPMRRTRVSATAIACALLTALPSTAGAAIDLDDPNLFGPGEAWDRPADLERGDAGPWVMRLQRRLAAAGFRPGRIDGVFGQATLGAVYAFQKITDLERDGIVHDEDWALLEEVVLPELPPVADQPDRVEVDLEAQVLYLVRDQRVQTVLPISSGNGELYQGRGGRLARANTPEGSYTFNRHIDGWRISYLGGLYRPYYFRGGYAIHGSGSVPPFPASHGCVRVEIHDMDFLVTQVAIGMPVHVYGIDVSRADLFDT